MITIEVEIPENTMTVLTAIAAERKRQDDRWGADRQHPDTLWYTILGEEYGEVGRAILEGMDGGDEANAPEPTGEPDQHLYNELIQVAAVAACHAEAVRARISDDVDPAAIAAVDAMFEAGKLENDYHDRADVNDYIAGASPQRPLSLKRATIGTLITVLEDIKQAGGGKLEVMFDGHLYPDGTIASYRGYYEQAALGWSGKLTDVTVDTLIEVLRGAIGRTFVGWKGGDYEFHTDTPLWLANRGATDGERSIMVPAVRISGQLVHLGTVNYDESPEFASLARTIGKVFS